MESWKIIAILFISMIIFTPFVIMFNPKVKEKMKARNNNNNKTENEENNQ